MGQVITRHRVKYSRGPEFEHPLTKLANRIARRYPGRPSDKHHKKNNNEYPEREAIREASGNLIDLLSFASDPLWGCPPEALDELVAAFLVELECIRRGK